MGKIIVITYGPAQSLVAGDVIVPAPGSVGAAVVENPYSVSDFAYFIKSPEVYSALSENGLPWTDDNKVRLGEFASWALILYPCQNTEVVMKVESFEFRLVREILNGGTPSPEKGISNELTPRRRDFYPRSTLSSAGRLGGR